ncbi:UDP-Glycosyltransferase/glycogen phosphorylase [Coccomyxa subellipsoidea C-169]|uniref:UDP-Glycosyltransferase/glycogen phosphorylase n=1 Tax=Coccomyxa subellipsoidea (strain C-169) TaxID=574566 RepID=I0YNU2_COCSC|nr:UDP-Glycosyltransferase/glycogen phosphorylase [Coccomyxa subellipsoidea C-169]EIE20061.1 UDP-Glycosyltransferase/glycogen phosphorylase [Coccomyxa subellipsoidea C-169]|eukprot:XP_005644605.1 UDP-Glycosyltransferase/glycogen phosphorylase [Coccomyxa subellipsoidea C-169]
MLLPNTITQHQSSASAGSTCKPGSTSLTLRVSTFRPPNVTRKSIAQKRRPATVTSAQAAEVLAVPQPEKADAHEEKKKIAIFVEPSPFSHVSGMKIRFSNLIKGLRQLGDDVMVVTPCINPPKTFHGAKVVNVLGFSLPFYRSPTLLLSLGLSVRVLYFLITQRPDVIHVSSPGLLVFAATLYAKLLAIPLVVSYHTHIPEYIPKYTWKGLVGPMWRVIRFNILMADLTLVPSKTMKTELSRNKCRPQRIDVWQQAVDTDVFNPGFRSAEMRARMSGGKPDSVILTYVGRLGAEKNLEALKGMMERLPSNVCLCFVGDGPSRPDLAKRFEGLPVYFTGMLRGEELSSAYASADIFMMPSETETLGFVALEAMASGLPVVAVAAGGLVDIITKPGYAGHLYAPNDYTAATELTRKLVHDVAAREAMGQAARAHVEKLGWMAAVRRIRDHQYQRAIHTFRAHKRCAALFLLPRNLFWKAISLFKHRYRM